MADLEERLKAGDVAAFESLFNKHQKLVYRTAYLITGDGEEAKDVMQEVFVAVWKWRHTFDPQKGKFNTWLHRITVNQCCKRRKKKRVVCLPLDGDEGEGFCPDDPEELPEDIMITREEHDRLMSALSSLDTKHRSVLVLRFFNELSYDEIADVAGISLGTVKSRIHYALKTLRRQMAT